MKPVYTISRQDTTTRRQVASLMRIISFLLARGCSDTICTRIVETIPFPDPDYTLPDNGTVMGTTEALDRGIKYLGEGYYEASTDRFVSDDGFRQLRIQNDGLLGTHAGGPHINFDLIFPRYITRHVFFC